jgi:RNA polymerase sigma factor (sigma-70 family)
MNVPARGILETRPSFETRQFERIVLPHLAAAHDLARGLTGSRSDAQDVVQEASIRALRGIGGFGNGNARAWMLAIVRNAAFDWLQKNRAADLVFVERVEDVEAALPAIEDAVTPEETLIRLQSSARLAAAIAALPAHLRNTLWLRDVQGWSYRDVAERLGLSPGTVMSRLFRARRRLIAADRSQRRGRA